MRELSAEAEALWRAVEVANTSGSAQARVVPLLVQLARVAPERSEAWTYAHRELAAHLLAEDPWRASICARRVLDHSPRDAMAWGILGLTQSVLGNHDYAVWAYRRALRHEPHNPWYAHNLGHLLDVAFDRPHESVPLLERALRCLAGWPDVSRRHWTEMSASLAHAHARAGDPRAAYARIRAVVQSGLATEAHHELYRHIGAELEDRLEEAMKALGPISQPRRKVRQRRETATASN